MTSLSLVVYFAVNILLLVNLLLTYILFPAIHVFPIFLFFFGCIRQYPSRFSVLLKPLYSTAPFRRFQFFLNIFLMDFIFTVSRSVEQRRFTIIVPKIFCAVTLPVVPVKFHACRINIQVILYHVFY